MHLARIFMQWMLPALFMSALLAAGLQLRRWTWQETSSLRFQHDITNGLYWGGQTLAEARRTSPAEASPVTWSGFFRGYQALYDRVKEAAPNKNYQLDYPPLRLLVMSLWAKHVEGKFPGMKDAAADHAGLLLGLNLLCELLSALAIFQLVHFWIRQADGITGSRLLCHKLPQSHRAFVCGLAAASAAWLDPSLILDAYGWPQWDVWILPFYLFAALCASKSRWFWCGCLLGAGVMLKGQLALVAPFFVFWPLWQRRWDHALEILAGIAASVAALVSPWLLRGSIAWSATALFAGAVCGVVLQLKARRPAIWVCGLTALAAFVIGALTGGSFSWLEIGFIYGSERYANLCVSPCYNLPSLLAHFGWGLKDRLWGCNFGSFQFELTLQWTLRFVYLAGLLFCARAAARHARSRDPRALIAIAAPWLLMFALLGQMHERYLMWGSVLSAVAFGVSLRLTALHFIISIASTTMILHVMLLARWLDSTLGVIDLLNGIRLFGSCAILAAVAVWYWLALSTRWPFHGRPEPSAPCLAFGSSAERA